MKRLDKIRIVTGAAALALAVGGALLLETRAVDAGVNIKLHSDATVISNDPPKPKPTGEYGFSRSGFGF